MSKPRRNKKNKVYSVVPETAYRKKTITMWVIKYGNLTAFIAGILIFASGIYGEYLGLPGYHLGKKRFKDPSDLDPRYYISDIVPYWTNCVFGLVFMSGYIKEKLSSKK